MPHSVWQTAAVIAIFALDALRHDRSEYPHPSHIAYRHSRKSRLKSSVQHIVSTILYNNCVHSAASEAHKRSLQDCSSCFNFSSQNYVEQLIAVLFSALFFPSFIWSWRFTKDFLIATLTACDPLYGML
jgi:hypothetical protein